MPKRQFISMKKELDDAMAEAKTMAFIHVVRRHGNADLNDVFELAKMAKLEHIDIKSLLVDDLPRTGKEWSRKALGSGAKKKAVGTGGLEVRTAEGRRTFDASVLKELSLNEDWTKAPDLQEKTGGNPDQTRRALNRLIESGKIKYKGKARGTQYKAR